MKRENPAVAAFPSGDLLVAWTEQVRERPAGEARSAPSTRQVGPRGRASFFPRTVVARWFRSDGGALAPPLHLGGGIVARPEVLALAGDHALVTWIGRGAHGDEIRVRTLAAGEPSRDGGSSLLLGDLAPISSLALSGSPGGVIVLWAEGSQLRALSVDPSGEAIAAPFQVWSGPATAPVRPAVASFGGRHLAAWVVEADGGAKVLARWLGNGGVQGPIFDVTGDVQPRAAAPAVAVDRSEEARIAWAAVTKGAEGGLAVARLPRAGSAVIGPVRLGPADARAQSLRVAPGPGGEFLVTWSEPEGDVAWVHTRLLPAVQGADGPGNGFDAITDPTGQPGTCYTTQCQQCRAAGWTSAHDQCVYWTVGATASYRTRFRYTGADEGHDHAANLLWYKGDGVDDVCNVSKGSCCTGDSGCFLGIGGCSGSASARVCKATQSCAGEFAGSTQSIGGFQHLGFTGRLIGKYSGKPYDCDCISGVEGGSGGFEVHVNADGTIQSVELWPPSDPNSGAGTISWQGSQYSVQTHKALTCGTYYDGVGCVGLSRQIQTTAIDSRQAAWGNPDFTYYSPCP
jgi:hypothetical protein